MQSEKEKFVRRKTAKRFIFAALTLVAYFSFAFNWTVVGGSLRDRLGDSHVTGSLVMFTTLIVIFILLEICFIYLGYRQEMKQKLTTSSMVEESDD